AVQRLVLHHRRERNVCVETPPRASPRNRLDAARGLLRDYRLQRLLEARGARLVDQPDRLHAVHVLQLHPKDLLEGAVHQLDGAIRLQEQDRDGAVVQDDHALLQRLPQLAGRLADGLRQDGAVVLELGVEAGVLKRTRRVAAEGRRQFDLLRREGVYSKPGYGEQADCLVAGNQRHPQPRADRQTGEVAKALGIERVALPGIGYGKHRLLPADAPMWEQVEGIPCEPAQMHDLGYASHCLHDQFVVLLLLDGRHVVPEHLAKLRPDQRAYLIALH